MTESTAFEGWAIVELMGRQRMAGYMCERVIAGAGMLQVDVPACGEIPAFTRLISPTAIYAINPCSEQIARMLAERLRERPVQSYDLKLLTSSAATIDDDDDADPGDDPPY